MTIAAVLYFAMGAPSFDAPYGTVEKNGEYQAMAIIAIGTLAGGSWIGTQLDRRRVLRQIQRRSVERLARALSGAESYGPNTPEVEAFLSWIMAAPDAYVQSFTIQDSEGDRDRWRDELHRVALDVARRGDLLALPVYERRASEAVDRAFVGRYPVEPIPSLNAARNAAVDLVHQPYVDQGAFRARMRRYTKQPPPRWLG